MDLPLTHATKRQIASGTAPKRRRAPAKYWFGPDLWPDIAAAAIRKDWSPGAIVQHLTATTAGAACFKGLSRSTVWRMFDRTEQKAWSARTMKAVESENSRRVILQPLGCPHMLVSVQILLSRLGTLTIIFPKAKHPEVINRIEIQIRTLRQNGVPISAPVVRAIMLGVIQQACPHLLDGKKHQLPRSSVHNFMHSMHYSYRVATQSAKSTPKNWLELGRNMAIRIARSIHTHRTPPELVINADQTGIHLFPLPGHTWNPCGDKQVQVLGKEEKCQVTLMMASTSSGSILPSQVIVPGKTVCSLPPHEKCLKYSQFIKYFVSGGDKHWSNQQMMKAVSTISVCLTFC